MSLKVSNFRAVDRPQAVVEELLVPCIFELMVFQRSLMIGKTNLAEVLDECEVGSNTYRALQRTPQVFYFGNLCMFS